MLTAYLILLQGVNCPALFKNGICDQECNVQDCLFDGYDCQTTPRECNPLYEKYCQDHYANGE